jgi:hypothetical protein
MFNSILTSERKRVNKNFHPSTKSQSLAETIRTSSGARSFGQRSRSSLQLQLEIELPSSISNWSCKLDLDLCPKDRAR